MVPAGAVEQSAAEAFRPGDVRIAGVVEDTGGGDEDIGAVAVAAAEFHLPAALAIVRPGGFLTEAGQLVDTVFAGSALEIGLDFPARRQVPAPVRIAFETVGIKVGGHVAGQAWIGIVAPGPADPVCLFVEGDVGIALFLQADAGKNTGHAGAENDDTGLAGRH